MRQIQIILLLVAGLLFFQRDSLIAQQQFSHHGDHCETHDDHFHAQELGLSIAPVWFAGEEEPGAKLGLHAHYIKRLGDSQFGLGLGAEFIADEHKHQTYSFVGQWTPLPALHLVIAPGVALEQEEDFDGTTEQEMGWAVHFELVKEFGIGGLDVGPSLEYALDSHGQHFAIGIHLGIPFE
ncbi:MAG: hypothetical protein O2818_05610 [Bacteroidetes bacterium]|nr:hypothetical protein [Bacteroidota bacterium]MDA1336349.1 hypothetical protein [Bacteroidota bacterium]